MITVFSSGLISFVNIAHASSSWTSTSNGAGQDLWGVGYGNGKFATVGTDTNIHWSTDGMNWGTTTSVDTPNNPFRVIPYYGMFYTGSQWMLVGAYSSTQVINKNVPQIYTSTDGSNWIFKSGNVPASYSDLYSVAMNGSTLVAVGSLNSGGQAYLATSTDGGTSWTDNSSHINPT